MIKTHRITGERLKILGIHENIALCQYHPPRVTVEGGNSKTVVPIKNIKGLSESDIERFMGGGRL